MDCPSTSGSHNNATNLPIKSRVDSCFVPMCPSTSTKFPIKIFLTGPSDPKLREKWLVQAAMREDSYSPKTVIRCCEDHFELEKDVENWIKFKIFGGKLFLKKDVVPHFFECQNRMTPMKPRSAILKRKRREILESIENAPSTTLESLEGLEIKETEDYSYIHDTSVQVTEQDAQPGPSKRKLLDTRTPIDSAGREQGQESRAIEQCRFCGEFSKDCVAVSGDMTYLAGNQTALALNDTRVQLDFNDRSLPNTVCRNCDAKLQEFCDFVKVVKAAQCTLINVAEEKAEVETEAEFEEPTAELEEHTAEFEETPADFEESTAEYEETEILVVKTEDNDDEGIIDPLAIAKTVVVNETHKSKSDTDTTKSKKLKTKEKCDDVLVTVIKEEVVEKDTNEQFEVSDIETDVKPSELELAKSALVFQAAEDGTSEYQGFRSDI